MNLVEAIARDFIERLPEDKKDALLNSIYAKTGARFATTTTLMYLLTSQMNSSIARYPKLKASLRILRGAAINSILTIGALAHRSAYDSRELREKTQGCIGGYVLWVIWIYCIFNQRSCVWLR